VRRKSEPVKVLSRLLLAPILAAVLLLACTPTNAARRVGGSAYDGTWSVAIYTLRGDCGSVRAAVRIVGGRVYSEDQSYQSSGDVGPWVRKPRGLARCEWPGRIPVSRKSLPSEHDGHRLTLRLPIRLTARSSIQP
jgi:hypothetical protein